MEDDDEDAFRERAMALYKTSGGRKETAAAAKQITGGKKKRGGKKSEPSKDDVRQMFDEIDDDGSGLLDRGETKALMVKLFPGMSDAEFDVAFAKMDDDGSGEVDFDEFAAWWKAELKEKGAELEAQMRKVREQMKLKKMAMQLYNADPNEDVSKLKANLAARAAKLKKDTQEKAVVVREIESDDDDDDDDDDTSSSDDGDEELRARRARDREIQRAKAEKINKSSVQDRVKGAKNVASDIRSRGKNLLSKIKNEDVEFGESWDEQNEHSALMTKRRRLFQKMKGPGDGDDLTTDSAEGNTVEDTKAAVEWELDFVKRARRKRTFISVGLGLVLFSVAFIPPLVVYLRDAACQAQSLSENMPFSVNVLEQLNHIEVETFRGVVKIQSDANLTRVDQISIDITKRATSWAAVAAISASAILSDQSLKVSARYDELLGGSFGISTCPQADIVIRVPLLSQSPRSSGPTLNVTVDGPIGEPVMYPWVPNLVGLVGEIDLSFNPGPASVVFGATLLRNTIGPISVKRFKATHLAAIASNGSVSIDSSTLSTVRVITDSGNIAIQTTELSRMEDITSEKDGAMDLGIADGSDYLQMRALGYAVHGSLHASSSSGLINIDQVSGGDIEARSGLGNIDIVLPIPGFSGPYDLRAPFGWKTVTVERLATRLGFSDADAVELDSMFANSTLLVDPLEHKDDSIFKEQRLGRVAGSRGEFGSQRLLAESSAGSVHCKLLERVVNESALIYHLGRLRSSG